MRRLRRPFRPLSVLCLGLLSVLGGDRPAAAQGAPTWKAIGPYGDQVNALLVDPKNPKTLLAGTQEGLFRSTDGAETWTNVGKGLGEITVLSLAADPKDPKTIYAGAWRGGLFKSVDGGATWKAVKPGKGGDFVYGRIPVQGLAVDPSNPKHLLFTSFFRTTDGGMTIADVDPRVFPCGSRDLFAVAFDPKSPKTVWAGGTGSLCRSQDGGATWKRVEIGVPDPAHIKTIAIHPRRPDHVFVGTGYAGVVRTTDGGATWANESEGLAEKASVTEIALDREDPERLYVAAEIRPPGDPQTVFRSTDGGATFEDVGGDLPWEEIGALALDPVDGKTLYAGTSFGGVYRTTDGGGTWEEKSQGFVGTRRTVTAVAVGPGNALFASTYGAIHRSDDGGKSWRRLPSGFEKGLALEHLAAVPAEPMLIVAGGDDISARYSLDGGATWSSSGRARPIRCLARNPASPSTLYACTKDGIARMDSGGSFKHFGPEDFTPSLVSIAFDPGNPEVVLAAQRGGGLHRTTNGGKKWKDFNKGVTKVKESLTSFGEYTKIFALAWDGASKTLYAATEEEGVLKSGNGGESWTPVGLAGEKLTVFAVDPKDGKRLAAGTDAKGVFLSNDGGTTWVNAAKGLPEKKRITSLAFGEGSPGKIYVASRGGSVYVAE